jgi:hypothetical protein
MPYLHQNQTRTELPDMAISAVLLLPFSILESLLHTFRFHKKGQRELPDVWRVRSSQRPSRRSRPRHGGGIVAANPKESLIKTIESPQ